MHNYYIKLLRENRKYLVYSAIGALIRLGVLLIIWWVASRAMSSEMMWYLIVVGAYAVLEAISLLTKTSWLQQKILMLQESTEEEHIVD
jgi:membrane protein DedA with SNARE-associated domain